MTQTEKKLKLNRKKLLEESKNNASTILAKASLNFNRMKEEESKPSSKSERNTHTDETPMEEILELPKKESKHALLHQVDDSEESVASSSFHDTK